MGERRPLLSTLLACCVAVAATVPRLLWPRQANAAFLAELESAPLPPAHNTVQLTALIQADLTAPTAIVAEGVRTLRSTPLTMATFLVRHPSATFLVDPAICAGVHERVLPELPFPVPLLVAPEQPVHGLSELLAANELTGADIDFVLPTHLHWDHVAGLYELPGWVPIRVPDIEYRWAMGGSHAPIGVARGPLRGRVFDLYDLDGPPVLTFARSHDLFGDGSVLLVDLAGHTPGSVGVLLAVDDGSRVLLAGDAVWSTLQVELLREKAPMPGELFDDDRDLAFETVHRLHALPEDIELIPGHDRAAVTARTAH
ncbi:MBL fold metallo-hydrolase [Nocardia rhizosphaerihabitans]|uniref:MBL fold metallo-hydrolase n=1 Tax=Nocardia rhizosphaerihabitans TaxID=1691570 RepID=UPI00366B296A